MFRFNIAGSHLISIAFLHAKGAESCKRVLHAKGAESCKRVLSEYSYLCVVLLCTLKTSLLDFEIASKVSIGPARICGGRLLLLLMSLMLLLLLLMSLMLLLLLLMSLMLLLLLLLSSLSRPCSCCCCCCCRCRTFGCRRRRRGCGSCGYCGCCCGDRGGRQFHGMISARCFCSRSLNCFRASGLVLPSWEFSSILACRSK